MNEELATPYYMSMTHGGVRIAPGRIPAACAFLLAGDIAFVRGVGDGRHVRERQRVDAGVMLHCAPARTNGCSTGSSRSGGSGSGQRCAGSWCILCTPRTSNSGAAGSWANRHNRSTMRRLRPMCRAGATSNVGPGRLRNSGMDSRTVVHGRHVGALVQREDMDAILTSTTAIGVLPSTHFAITSSSLCQSSVGYRRLCATR